VIDHFLDIYSKLLIAVITFIAPLTSYLLSTYLKDRKTILVRLEVQKITTDDLLDKEIEDGRTKKNSTTEIFKQGIKIIKDKEKEIELNRNRIRFLNPKKRIKWLFIYLILSMSTLLFQSLVRGNVFNLYGHNRSVIFLGVSCFSFLLAIIMLIRIVWKLVETRELIMKEEKQIQILNRQDQIIPAIEVVENPLPSQVVD
jgi:cytochrome b561